MVIRALGDIFQAKVDKLIGDIEELNNILIIY